MTRRLIVNADDFGRSPGINRGIVESFERGIVRSTTLMVNLPSTADAVTLAERVPGLGIGLHLNFCYGPALASDVPSLLTPDGLLDRDLDRLRSRATASDIHREATAQLARFRDVLGREPTHIDSHQHLHSWPAAIEPIALIARDIGVPVRACNAEHRATLRVLGVRCPDTFIIDFYGSSNIDPTTLETLLTSIPDGTTELMCHPGYVDSAIDDSSYRAEREIEIRTLCNASVRKTLDDRGIPLSNFDVLRDL